MSFGLLTVYRTCSVEGFSLKTQFLYQLVYFCRYLDVFTREQNLYLLTFKISYNAITALTIIAFKVFHNTYHAAVDSSNIVLTVLTAALAAFVTSHGDSFVSEMWSFSEFLEPFALVPQYIVCYRSSRVRPAVIVYVLLVGGYRALYICNWILKLYVWGSAYGDYTSWFGGGLECLIFADFVMRISKRTDVIGAIDTSLLGNLLLKADDGVGRISEKYELQVMGRRLPYGVGGCAAETPELSADCRPISEGAPFRSYTSEV
eukprot:TRINITY_DN76724_c0_g1_i1.p1 TRINITY_DN76724_c0_g1~~TRINITY_DN76724_c0_g1_i1.p1  ORF type:complete len:289 (+),score=46.77 TRINITY_DN76724_c0_g1_i1:86-868(+)